MNNPLKALIGSRVQPFTLPKTSLNPITHIELVTSTLEVAQVQKHNVAVTPASVSAGPMAALSLQFSQTGFGSTTTPDGGLIGGGGVTGGGSQGGGAGGGYSIQPDIPGDYVDGVDLDVGDVTVAPEDVASDADLNAARAPSGGGVYYAWAEPFSAVTQEQPSSIFATPAQPITTQPLISPTPSPTIAARTVIDAVVGSVYFELLNRGAAPLIIRAEVNGRFGDFELFNTLIKRVMPPMRKPVKFQAGFKFEGDDAAAFAKALMAEAGPTSKATLILDAVLQWNAFHHKITDARKVDVVLNAAL